MQTTNKRPRKRNIKYQFVLIGLVIIEIFGLATNSQAATKIYSVDFEEGASWNMLNYSAYDNSAYISVTNQGCPQGNYCGRTAATIAGCGSGQLCSPFFVDVNIMSIYNGSKQFFLRMKTKYPTNWEEQATDDVGGGGANHIRYEMNGANAILEYTKQFKFCQFASDTGGTPPHNNGGFIFYDSDDPVWDGDDYYRKDGIWHEEAYYFKLPSSATAYDGEFYTWTDGGPNYSLASADASKIWQWPTRYTYRTPQTNMYISFGNYYKGHVDVGYNPEFWMDDIQIWDGLPTSDATAPANPTGLSIS